MAHPLIDLSNINWIKKCENCILIRHPKDVINSYTAKNKLQSAEELGYPQQFKIAKFLKKSNKQFQVIDSEDLLKNPKNYYLIGAKISILILMNLCLIGKRKSSKRWYLVGTLVRQCNKNYGVSKISKKDINIENKYDSIYNESMEYYNYLKGIK